MAEPGIPNTGADPLGNAVPPKVKAELNKTPDVKAKEQAAALPKNPLMEKKPLPPSEGLKLGPESITSDLPGGGRKDDREDRPGGDKLDPAKRTVPAGGMKRRPGEKHRK
jgi:hypothetical protein